MANLDKIFQYYGFTLVDITPTGVTTYTPEKELERNQQRNWETVVQILSLRTQILECEFMNSVDANLEAYNFGINYSGIHRVWLFKFTVEYDGVYALGNDRYGKLKDDFKSIPVINNLHETTQSLPYMFYTAGPLKNIYFKSNKNN